MDAAVIFALAGFAVWQLLVSWRVSSRVRSLSEFLSFGNGHYDRMLSRTFEGTNITYGTVFVAFMLYPASYGWGALAIPLGFVLGIVFFVYVLLPRLMAALAGDERYPGIIARATGSTRIRGLIALLLVLSIWGYTFAEVQAVGLLLVELLGIDEAASFSIMSGMMVFLMLYVAWGGYQAMLKTDSIQILIVYIGAVCLVWVVISEVGRLGANTILPALAQRDYLLATPLDHGVFALEMLATLLFTQLYYYDNWQRLALFVRAETGQARRDGRPTSTTLQILQARIRRSYLKSTVVIGLIYLLPLMIGYLHLADGGQGSPVSYLVGLLHATWAQWPIVGPMMVLFIVLMLVSSLFSTVDSYSIGAAQIIYEDLLGRSLSESGASALRLIRRIIVGYLTLILLMLPFKPDMGLLLMYLIYSASGIIGPIWFAIARARVNRYAVIASMLFSLVFPLFAFSQPDSSWSAVAGLVTVAFSLLVVGLWRPTEPAKVVA